VSEPMTPDHARAARKAYDALSPGEKAQLRRCRAANEVLLEGAFWRVVSGLPAAIRPRMSHIVACFPTAGQRRRTDGFASGTFLRRALYAKKEPLKPSDTTRFRQLIEADDRDELVHRLRRALAQAQRPVDWGVLGADIYYWGDGVRRRWAQDFYAPGKEEDHA